MIKFEGDSMQIIVILFEILSFVVYLYVILSLFPNSRNSNLGKTVGKIVEPFLSVIRSVIPPLGRVDFSPIIIWVLIQLAIFGIKQLELLL